jgi:hypothetical protein
MTRALPCMVCGTGAPPRLEPGTGPHGTKARCAGCGRFLKWLPKQKEVCMHPSINRVTLVGAIGKYGVEVSYHGQGTAKATFTLIVVEVGSDGKDHQLWQPCEVWGKRAEQVGELEVGDVVLIEGKLRRVKRGESWETVVSGFEAHLLQRAFAGAAVVS